MSARIGYTFERLRDMHLAACSTDMRLVWKKDDEWNTSVYEPLSGHLTDLPKFCGVREIRLFAQQLLAYANERELGSLPAPHEVVLP